MKSVFLLFSCLAAAAVAAPAQTQVTVPNLPSFVDLDRPFNAGIGRYQQWYSAFSLQGTINEPMRFERLEFFAGLPPTSQAAQITCEVLVGHGKFSGVTSAFDNNWDSPPVVVRPQGQIPLVAGPSGTVAIDIQFVNRFTWDRTRPILVEIRVFGNSLSNQPFPYNFRGQSTSVGTTTRVYGTGSPTAASGTVQQGWGLTTRFSARPGAILSFGFGCPGEGNFVPVNTVQQVPSPGIVWSHQLSLAPSQRTAFWVFGDTRNTPFPVDLGVLFGLPASGCLLYTNPVVAEPVTTVGGGAGGGFASFGVALPGTTGYVGMSLFTQWVVFDPLAPSGLVTVTPAAWSIVAPVGG